MVRTQIQLTKRQAEELKRLAAQKNVSIAELIRQAVDQSLLKGLTRDPEEIRRRAAAAAGKFHSGKRDISTHHDEYLAEAFNE